MSARGLGWARMPCFDAMTTPGAARGSYCSVVNRFPFTCVCTFTHSVWFAVSRPESLGLHIHDTKLSTFPRTDPNRIASGQPPSESTSGISQCPAGAGAASAAFLWHSGQRPTCETYQFLSRTVTTATATATATSTLVSFRKPLLQQRRHGHHRDRHRDRHRDNDHHDYHTNHHHHHHHDDDDQIKPVST